LAKPGPSKGHGGRPRKPASQQATNSEGYRQITVGPKGKGTRKYVHQVVAGSKGGGKGSKTVIDHKDGNKTNNSRSNLRKLSRGKNAARGK